MTDERIRATVLLFIQPPNSSGWGFADPMDGTAHIFISGRTVRRAKLGRLHEGDIVEFAIVSGKSGNRQALDVTVIRRAKPKAHQYNQWERTHNANTILGGV